MKALSVLVTVLTLQLCVQSISLRAPDEGLGTLGLSALGRDPRETETIERRFDREGRPLLRADEWEGDASPEHLSPLSLSAVEGGGPLGSSTSAPSVSASGSSFLGVGAKEDGLTPAVARAVEETDADMAEEKEEGQESPSQVEVSSSEVTPVALATDSEQDLGREARREDVASSEAEGAGDQAALATAQEEQEPSSFLPASQAEVYHRRLGEARVRMNRDKKRWAQAVREADKKWHEHNMKQLKEWARGPRPLNMERVSKKVDVLSRKLFREYVNFFQRFYLARRNGPYARIAIAAQRGTAPTASMGAKDHLPPGIKKIQPKGITASGDPDSVSPIPQ